MLICQIDQRRIKSTFSRLRSHRKEAKQEDQDGKNKNKRKKEAALNQKAAVTRKKLEVSKFKSQIEERTNSYFQKI